MKYLVGKKWRDGATKGQLGLNQVCDSVNCVASKLQPDRVRQPALADFLLGDIVVYLIGIALSRLPFIVD
ncbi:hypothetical protein [Saccharothrix deserti]|uniref:hypothetical protein n=1 Tax=Saccharothrix deserti TaxID=2593674 RepID=UPI00131CD739|nr:hypothetical protein [Saccharothrix deserti]